MVTVIKEELVDCILERNKFSLWLGRISFKKENRIYNVAYGLGNVKGVQTASNFLGRTDEINGRFYPIRKMVIIGDMNTLIHRRVFSPGHSRSNRRSSRKRK